MSNSGQHLSYFPLFLSDHSPSLSGSHRLGTTILAKEPTAAVSLSPKWATVRLPLRWPPPRFDELSADWARLPTTSVAPPTTSAALPTIPTKQPTHGP
jgi:hypothetical protein